MGITTRYSMKVFIGMVLCVLIYANLSSGEDCRRYKKFTDGLRGKLNSGKNLKLSKRILRGRLCPGVVDKMACKIFIKDFWISLAKPINSFFLDSESHCAAGERLCKRKVSCKKTCSIPCRYYED